MASGGLGCGLWIGQIGTLPIAAWLQPGERPDAIEGRYGYLRLGKAIPLAGNSVTRPREFTLDARRRGDERVAAHDGGARGEVILCVALGCAFNGSVDL
jgi:hypothetical protein